MSRLVSSDNLEILLANSASSERVFRPGLLRPALAVRRGAGA